MSSNIFILNFFKIIAESCLNLIFPLICIKFGITLGWGSICICDLCLDSVIMDIKNEQLRKKNKRDILLNRLKNVFNIEVKDVFFIGKYEGILAELIKLMKYSSYSKLADRLSIRLSNIIEIQLENVKILSVPITTAGKKIRGFNQTEIMAKRISKELGIDYIKDVIKFKMKKKDQASSTYEERLKQMKGSMCIAKNYKHITGKSVLIVDDVMTTGATLSEAYRIVRSCSDKNIYFALIAVVLND